MGALESKENNQKLISELVSEITKQAVNQTKVKALTKKIGIPYASDLVEQMSIILMHCDQSQIKSVTQNKNQNQKLNSKERSQVI